VPIYTVKSPLDRLSGGDFVMGVVISLQQLGGRSTPWVVTVAGPCCRLKVAGPRRRLKLAYGFEA
jgi:hypothetical protein